MLGFRCRNWCSREWRLRSSAWTAITRNVSLYVLAVAVFGLLPVEMRAGAGTPSDTAAFESLAGELMLENDRVRVQMEKWAGWRPSTPVWDMSRET